ncbi:MAG: hemagglutinin repeat-containing protein [Burkholderiales bacterium]|nr:hemagglutinin repeat-containing protein [Burkholderiales bacterium]
MTNFSFNKKTSVNHSKTSLTTTQHRSSSISFAWLCMFLCIMMGWQNQQGEFASSTSSQVNGSTVTGNSVAMQAGNDVTIQGSDVVAIDALRINAAHNLTITSSVQTDSSTQSSQTSTSGLTAGYKSGVASIGVGKTSNNAQASSSSQTCWRALKIDQPCALNIDQALSY